MQILPRGSQICYMVRNVRPSVRPFVRHARGIALPVTLGSYPLGRLQAYRSVLRILRAICIGALCIPEPDNGDIQPCAMGWLLSLRRWEVGCGGSQRSLWFRLLV